MRTDVFRGLSQAFFCTASAMFSILVQLIAFLVDVGFSPLAAATAYGWDLQAWAILANHYHFIAYAPAAATSLRPMLQRLHSATARAVNRLDHTPGRQVWFQFWDTCLSYAASYYARLNYVHHNAVHHGLVAVAEQYEFCSAAWFAAQADPTFYRKVCSYKYDKVKIEDDF